MNWIAQHEVALRLFCFTGILLAMLLWEQHAPRRTLQTGGTPWQRRLQHFALTACNSIVLRLLPGIAAVHAALLADAVQWGLLQQWQWTGWSAGVLRC